MGADGLVIVEENTQKTRRKVVLLRQMTNDDDLTWPKGGPKMPVFGALRRFFRQKLGKLVDHCLALIATGRLAHLDPT